MGISEATAFGCGHLENVHQFHSPNAQHKNRDEKLEAETVAPVAT